MELSRCLQGHLASHSHEVAIFVLRQLDDVDLCSQRHASSIVRLLAQVGQIYTRVRMGQTSCGRDCGGTVEGLWRDCGGTVEGLWRDCGGTVEVI